MKKLLIIPMLLCLLILASCDSSPKKTIPTSNTDYENITGIPIKIENFEVAQYNFSESMNWYDAQEVCAAIRIELRKIAGDEIADNCRILYGGSVKSINTLDIMKEVDVDGALVGGASLDPEEFARIAKFHRVLNKA